MTEPREGQRKKEAWSFFLTDGLVSNEAACTASTYQFKSPERKRAGERGRDTEERKKC